MAYGTINADVIQSSVTGVSLGAGNATVFKNRIINGNMVIDQRNAGASVATTTTGAFTYTLDRWSYLVAQASKFTIQQNAASVTPPAGFSYYLGCTSTSAYSVVAGDYFAIVQKIEGFNFADFGWGTANAKTITLSFQVYSSLTGTFGGSLRNSASSRSYPFTYTISTANTWTSISITIAGDTSGTWIGATNGVGLELDISLGTGTTYSGTAGSWSGGNYTSATGATSVVGTSGATFYITGVQLEVGSSATGFEYVDYGAQLIQCQRYFEKSYNYSIAPGTATTDGLYYQLVVGNTLTSNFGGGLRWSVTKRAAITFTSYDTLGASGKCNTDGQGTGQTLSVVFGSQTGALCYVQSLTNPGALSFHWAASAEL